MKPLVFGIILVLALIIQATLLPLVAIKGVQPDLLLIVVVSWGLLAGKEQGIGLGFFAGLIQDLASGAVFGMNVLSKMATGYASGMLERQVFKENYWLPVMGVLTATLFNNTVIFVVLFLLGYSIGITELITNIVYPVAYNMVFALPVHFFVLRITKRWINITG
ncbi:MAG: rod shape-determining protein MreD [Firmicutes bacterium]|nr:rod shape-determining protein MreD [Bacillota bacterium]